MGTGIELKRILRALLAGSLVLGGALTAVAIGGEVPASASVPPTTSVIIPSNGATPSGTAATLDATASNATSVEFWLFGGSYGYTGHLIGTATPTLYGWLYSWDTTTVPNGSYALLSEAFGPGGSAFSSHVSISVNNAPFPTTSVIIPSNGATLSGTASLDATASNATTVVFGLFGGSYGYSGHLIGTATLTLYGWLYSWDTTTVPNGSYALLSEAFGSDGHAFSSHVSITVNNNKALWFTNFGSNSIGRITTAGVVTNYTATAIFHPVGITLGPDGALWFTNSDANSIGRITTSGTVTSYTSSSIAVPEGITAGPDGALWFTNAHGGIGRITTAGVVTSYTGTGISEPTDITVGPDGALWFTNFGASIGRITTSGTVTSYTGTGINEPYGITVGPDGALWFTNFGNFSIGRITTSGTVTSYSTTSASSEGITAGPDGALWFTNGSIHRITTSGTLTNDYTGTGISGASGITPGSDGALWFTNFAGASIGRITTSGTVTSYTGTGINEPDGITVGP
jgi:virginiamycin B lyase